MSKILLVEDNQKYASAAEQYLTSKNNIVVLAKDYSQTMEKLTNPQFDCIITDCFFPEITGSNKINLGKELVNRMAKPIHLERKMIQGLEILGQYVDLNDPDMEKYSKFLINTLQETDITENPIVKAIKKVSMLGKEITTSIAKNSIGMLYREDKSPTDYHSVLMKAMDKSESNQPLGILVAEKADELNLPFILTTSTYHHDILTQPVQDYAFKKRWMLVDCGSNKEDEKASPEFWKKAFSELERKLI
ncbi:MAG: response regulator [Nanoarchaeota archaeon]|nr:response regulator [Nanoarchaeota archaeon]